MPENGRTLLLFDVDGTLTESQRPVGLDVLRTLAALRHTHSVDIAVVSGSDIGKILTQFKAPDVHNLLVTPHSLHGQGLDLLSFVFAENGLVAYSSTERLCYTQTQTKIQGDLENRQIISTNNPMESHCVELCKMNFLEYLGEQRYQTLVNYILKQFADITLPRKRGNMIELRSGVLNVSPIGRNCTIQEREEFYQYDQLHNIRQTLCADLSKTFEDYGLQFSCGGQISIDIYPKGWDKTFCLSLLNLDYFSDVYFFGDRCVPGGNDFTIYCDDRITHPISVSGPEETLQQLVALSQKLRTIKGYDEEWESRIDINNRSLDQSSIIMASNC